MSGRTAPPSGHLNLDASEEILPWFERALGETVYLDDLQYADVWVLVGLAALARSASPPPHIELSPQGPVSRFAHAMGMASIIGQGPSHGPSEDRSVRMQTIDPPPHGYSQYETLARDIGRLLLPTDVEEPAYETVRYVMVELLRNAVQHSGDPHGGIVAAQRMTRGLHAKDPVVQVAVADAGVGIHAALRGKHPAIVEPQQALIRSIEPHISGTFEEGLTSNEANTNAGMGLFFIAEMAKLTSGRLLIASRGAATLLTGNPDDPGHGQQTAYDLGFPGTLVVFEVPVLSVHDYEGMLDVIRSRARERTPARTVNRWLRFDPAPAGAQRLLVSVAAENTSEAEAWAKTLRPLLMTGKPLALDFSRIQTATQSFVHALLYEPIRLAWALKTPIHVVRARPAVQTMLQLLEAYALGG